MKTGTPRDNPELIRRAIVYHHENPQVFVAFDKYVRELLRRGKKKISHGTIIERIRWEYMIEVFGEHDFKINQNFGAFYARLWTFLHPEYTGLFEERTSCFDGLDMRVVSNDL